MSGENRAVQRPLPPQTPHWQHSSLRMAGSHSAAPPPEDYSIWRHTALRYLGYADEVGEFTVSYFGGAGKCIGYVIAGLYCIADLGSTLGHKLKNAGPDLSAGQKAYKTVAEGIDLSFFHLFATMLIPPQILGVAAASADRMLDPSVLAEAKAHLKPIPANGNVLQRLSGWISHQKLALETSANKGLAPHVDAFLNQRAKSLDDTSAVSKAASWLFDTHRAKVKAVVDSAITITNTYNRVMPLACLKADELIPMLERNRQALSSSAEKLLGPKQLARLFWTKPMPVLVGLGLIPPVAHSFDHFMVRVQNWTTRLLFGKNKLAQEQGQWVSKRNPEFWGKRPSKPTGTHVGQPGNYKPLRQNGRHLHQAPAHFGTVPSYPYNRYIGGPYPQMPAYGNSWQPMTSQPARNAFRPVLTPASQPGYPTGYRSI